MSTPMLSIENLTKRFEEQDAVNGISLCLQAGEIVAVKGPHGSGKTTLLKLAAGILQPTSGTVLLEGLPFIAGKTPNAEKIGVLFHQHGFYERLTIRQYLTYFQKLYQLPASRVDEVIALAGLIDRSGLKLRKASESFLARVRLARAMLHQPKLLLLDEPTTQLDLETTQILRHMILSASSDGTAVLLTTTSYEESTSLASRTALLSKGRIEAWENAAESGQSTEDQNTQNPTCTEPSPRDASSPNTSLSPMTGELRLKLEKIPARVNDRIILFNPLELIYMESQEGQSLLHTLDEILPCPLTLTELEERLKPLGFFRSHRSYIVNLQHVREVIPWTRNSYSLILDDAGKSSIPLSKNCVKELEGILGI